MAFLYIVSFILANCVSLASATNANQTRKHHIYTSINDTIGIYHGYDVLWGSFPFIILIYDTEYNTPCCGGTIIQLIPRSVILTAAHCVANCRYPEVVHVGCQGAYCSNAEVVEYRIADWNIIPFYSASSPDYDVALAYIDGIIVSPSNVDVIPLYTGPALTSGAILEVLGYGKTDEEEYATSLQSGIEHYMIQSICEDLMEWWTAPLTARMFCMRSHVQDTAVCMGDSGSPVMFSYQNERYQVGIVSWGMGQSCSGALPQVQANLENNNIKTWIASNKTGTKGMNEESKVNSLPTVLITGASRGIGRSIAIHLSLSGKYKLALLSRNVSKLNETINLCKNVNSNVQILPLKCDINNTNALKQCIRKCADEFGPYAVLINNAGIYEQCLITTDLTDDKIIRTLNTNLTSLIIACRESVPYLKKTKSLFPEMKVSIIQISSTGSTVRGTDCADSIYCAAKFGVRGFSDVLFKEVKDFGIKICQLMPGWVNTEMTQKYSHKLILKNMIQPSDVSYAVDFVLNCPETCCPLELLLYPQYECSKNKAKL